MSLQDWLSGVGGQKKRGAEGAAKGIRFAGSELKKFS
jgi:hypothetical protein